jgi:8-amino-7-oxononanoate synthase
VDIFEKCYNFTRADEVKAMGYYPYFHAIQESEGPEVFIEGRKFIMAGSNNYLGLTAHPRVKEAAIKAINKYGTSCSGSRYLTGTIELHEQLEEKLAKYLGYESVLLFSTGYQTSLGVLSSLSLRGDYLILDKEDHACIISGAVLAKGATSDFVRYKHNDMKDLERVIKNLPESAGKLIVTDGVFSVTGEIVNLPDLIEIAKKYNARVLVDDAHSVGVIGAGGRGTPSHFGLTDQTDMVMGTFSKTFSSLGGFVAGPERVINFLKHHSPALIFSASPTPASVASALASLEILEEQPELVTRLNSNADYVRQALIAEGFNIIPSETAIVPVVIGDMMKSFQFWKALFDSGVYVNAFIPPGVPPEMSMMRTSFMATHEKHHLDRIIEIFKKVGKDLELI